MVDLGDHSATSTINALQQLSRLSRTLGKSTSSEVLDAAAKILYQLGFEGVRYYVISEETIPEVDDQQYVFLVWEQSSLGEIQPTDSRYGYPIPWSDITLSRQGQTGEGVVLGPHAESDFGSDSGSVNARWVSDLRLNGKSWVDLPVYDSGGVMLGMLAADWTGPLHALSDEMKNTMEVFASLVGSMLVSTAPPVQESLQDRLGELHTRPGSTNDVVFEAVKGFQNELEIAAASIFHLDWTTGQLRRIWMKVLGGHFKQTAPFNDAEVFALDDKLTGKAWSAPEYRRVLDYARVKIRRPELISDESHKFHQDQIGGAHTIMYGVLGERTTRYLVRLINLSGHPKTPFVAEYDVFRHFVEVLCPIIDSRIAADRTALVTELSMLLTQKAQPDRVAIALGKGLLRMNEVDQILVIAHRDRGSMPHFIWNAEGRIVRSARRDLLSDPQYGAVTDESKDSPVIEILRNGPLRKFADAAFGDARAVAGFPFRSGGTVGSLILPLRWAPKQGRLAELLQDDAVAFLRQASAIMGQAIETHYVSVQAGGAMNALSHVGHELDSHVAALASIADDAVLKAKIELSRVSRGAAIRTSSSYFEDMRDRVEYHADILSSAVKLGNLVGRQRDRRFVGVRRSHSVLGIINAAAERVRQQIAKGEIRAPRTLWWAEAVGEINGNIVCERGLVESAVTNLYRNAAKYSLEHGDELVEIVTRVKVKRSLLEISITNHGVAIPPYSEENMFDAFVRLDQDESDVTRRGMGLGLFLARQVARAHHGDVVLNQHDRLDAVRSSRTDPRTEARYRTTFVMTLSLDLPEGDYEFEIP